MIPFIILLNADLPASNLTMLNVSNLMNLVAQNQGFMQAIDSQQILPSIPTFINNEGEPNPLVQNPSVIFKTYLDRFLSNFQRFSTPTIPLTLPLKSQMHNSVSMLHPLIGQLPPISLEHTCDNFRFRTQNLASVMNNSILQQPIQQQLQVHPPQNEQVKLSNGSNDPNLPRSLSSPQESLQPPTCTYTCTTIDVHPHKATQLQLSKEKHHSSPHSSASSPSSKRRRARTNFSGWQLSELDKAFIVNHYPDLFARQALAASLDLPESRVQVC